LTLDLAAGSPSRKSSAVPGLEPSDFRPGNLIGIFGGPKRGAAA
jgi:hypothetical protein